MTRIEQVGPRVVEPPPVENPQSSNSRWAQVETLNQIWEHVPSVVERFDQVAASPQLQAALDEVVELSDAELEAGLASDLGQSYGDLGQDCPRTIADMRDRNAVVEHGAGTIGNPRDYLMQRLTTVATMLDFLKQLGQLPPSLQRSFEAESQRLARFLVAIERFEEPKAAAAK
jgi:hypothetical protein